MNLIYLYMDLQTDRKKGGRPAFRITKEVTEKAEELASLGLTLEQIASCMGICYQTLNEKKKEFSDALSRGRALGLAWVSNALYQTAISGNVRAMIFFLKTRGGGEWQERSSVKADLSLKRMSDTELLNAIRNDSGMMKLIRPRSGA